MVNVDSIYNLNADPALPLPRLIFCFPQSLSPSAASRSWPILLLFSSSTILRSVVILHSHSHCPRSLVAPAFTVPFASFTWVENAPPRITSEQQRRMAGQRGPMQRRIAHSKRRRSLFPDPSRPSRRLYSIRICGPQGPSQGEGGRAI